jgi:hypothetical protein
MMASGDDSGGQHKVLGNLFNKLNPGSAAEQQAMAWCKRRWWRSWHWQQPAAALEAGVLRLATEWGAVAAERCGGLWRDTTGLPVDVSSACGITHAAYLASTHSGWQQTASASG